MGGRSATLGWLAGRRSRLHIQCRAPRCWSLQKAQCGGHLTLTAEEAARRWGEATTLADLRPRLRCACCGSRQHVVFDFSPLDVSPGASGGFPVSIHPKAHG
jgi:hypothetical protein